MQKNQSTNGDARGSLAPCISKQNISITLCETNEYPTKIDGLEDKPFSFPFGDPWPIIRSVRS